MRIQAAAREIRDFGKTRHLMWLRAELAVPNEPGRVPLVVAYARLHKSASAAVRELNRVLGTRYSPRRYHNWITGAEPLRSPCRLVMQRAVIHSRFDAVTAGLLCDLLGVDTPRRKEAQE